MRDQIIMWSTVCGAILVILTFFKVVGLPVWRALHAAVKNINLIATVVLGDKDKGIKSITERFDDQDAKLDEHIRKPHWPAVQPDPSPPPYTNGPANLRRKRSQ